jgi:hypothetical protein
MTDVQDTTATGSAVSDKHFGKPSNAMKTGDISRTKETLKKMVGDLDLDMDELEMLDPDGINGIFDDDVQAEEQRAA